MACIDFLIWIGTPKKSSVTKEGKKPARYSSIDGYKKEAKELGCCRKIYPLPARAVPGKSRVFLVHQGNHKRLDRGSIFGYFTLKRIELITVQQGPDPIKEYRDKWPRLDEYYEEFKRKVESCRGSNDEAACIKKRYSRNQKFRLLRDVSLGEVKFNDSSSDIYTDPFEKIVHELLEEFMKMSWEELKGILKSWDYEKEPQEQAIEDYVLVPQELADGAGGLGCSKRKDPGAVYLVNALSSEITDQYHEKFYEWLLNKGPIDNPGKSRKELIEIQKSKESKEIYPEEGNELFRMAQKKILANRKPKDGELIIFDEPYPIFQRLPRAAFRNYFRIDGDKLLEQIKKGGKTVTPVIPYCTGSEIEKGKPMTKEQMVIKIVTEANLTKTVVNKVLCQLSELVPDELNRAEAITIPGLGKLVLSDRKERKGTNPKTREEIKVPAKKVVKFRPAKKLKEDVNQ